MGKKLELMILKILKNDMKQHCEGYGFRQFIISVPIVSHIDAAAEKGPEWIPSACDSEPKPET